MGYIKLVGGASFQYTMNWKMTLSEIPEFEGINRACPWECHSCGNSTGNVPWDGTGQHTFVFPMRLRNRMRESECY